MVLPDDWVGIRTAPLLLLTRADVRTDLKLDEKQITESVRAVHDLRTRAAATRGRPRNEVRDEQKAIDEAQQLWIATHLSAVQRDRLIQLDLQWEGPSALISRPVVADALELTPDQRATITSAVKQRNAVRNSGKGTLADETNMSRTVLGALSPVQRERWFAMIGRTLFRPQIAAQSAPPAS